MLDHLGTGCLHQVATPGAYLGPGIGFDKRPHQIGSVQVARGFARYDVVFHRKIRDPIF